jgi:D-alanyl-lipoteichoic acid acyltransferase DltB (MBOAT superfamily)
VQFKTIYLLLATSIFYLSKNLVYLGEKQYICICWGELFLIKYLIKAIQRKFDINSMLTLENCIDNLSWEMLLIYSLLKMISFNLEYKKIYNEESVPESIFNLNQAKSHCMECYDGNFCMKCLENTIVADKDKIDESFNFINFISYVFYPPLLYAGPIINYNSFIFQLNIYKDSQHNILLKMNKILYTLKLIFFFAVMEIYNHFLFPTYLFKNKDKIFEPNADVSLFYYCFICLNILTFCWLKYSIIWKSFRLWAWCDGIFVEENMNRFIYNFYSIELFFRGMNRSLNRWMVRYIYLPLGGKNKKYINIWIAFGFWYLIYDYKNIDYALFALCCCILMDFEMYIKNTFINRFGEDFNEKIYLRYAKYVVCSFFVLIMYIIGLFGLGYSFSLNNLKVVLDTVVEKEGYFYFLKFILFLLPNVVMMFYIRDIELENCVLLHKKPLNY